MNIVCEKRLNNVGRVVMTDYNGDYRILVEFDSDPSYFHDASDIGKSLYGIGTRINDESEAAPVKSQYALHVFRQECALLWSSP